ncbi:hypothetical protein HDU84_002782 [Entophlyctis sp. JEL0112]|nr:hypothetical protein HDU84_002782 [Entophlyctis sp. JEL0112]
MNIFQQLQKTLQNGGGVGGSGVVASFGSGFGLGISTTVGGGRNRPSSTYLQPGLLGYKFQRAWDNIVVDCETEANWSRNVEDTDIPRNLNIMVDILVKEHAVVDGGVDSGGCTEKFLGEDMMAKLVSFSESDVPSGFRGQVITFLTNLLLVLDPKILIHNAIHRPLLTLISACLEDKKYDRELLQLELDICGKIYDFPQLTHIFFSKSRNKRISYEPSPAAVTGHDFIIFDHILRYIHDEGIQGDFARESALFLIELAAGDLATYINLSEFSAVAIAGLGGVFSQLPDHIPPGVSWGEIFKGHSINSPKTADANLRMVRRPAEMFRQDVEALVRVLNFVQAVVLRCPNSDITTSILEDFQGTFLDNIVQSSLTSASDFDGTTVSNLFYLQKMLETLKEDCMVSILLQFLLSSDATDDDEEDEAKKRAMRKSMHRRSVRPASILSMGRPLILQPQPQELRLHIRDILISKLNSLSEEVVIATLNLVRVILSNHAAKAIHLLIERLPQPTSKEKSDVIDEEATEGSHTGDQSPLTQFAPGTRAFTSAGSIPIKISAHTHLWILSRYFALVPADTPISNKFVRAAPTQPFDLLSKMESFLNGDTLPTRSMVQGPNGLVPAETSLSSYISEAEGIVTFHSQTAQESPRARAHVDMDEILLLGAAGGSKGNDAERSKKRKKARNPHLSFLMSEAEDGGVLKRGSLERNLMTELSKDSTLRKIMDKLSEFFSHSYAINLALTGVITQLVTAPIPLLYLYLFAADIMLGQRGVISPLTPTHSLFTILIRLRREVEQRRASTPDFDIELNLFREEMFGQRRQQQQLHDNVSRRFGGLDFQDEFYKNVVLLEEFTKELLSVLVIHGSTDHDQAVDQKKEDFRKYLEKNGIIDALTKGPMHSEFIATQVRVSEFNLFFFEVLVGLYEEPEKPESPIEFIKQFLGGPGDVDVEALKHENEELKRRVEELQARIDELTSPTQTMSESQSASTQKPLHPFFDRKLNVEQKSSTSVKAQFDKSDRKLEESSKSKKDKKRKASRRNDSTQSMAEVVLTKETCEFEEPTATTKTKQTAKAKKEVSEEVSLQIVAPLSSGNTFVQPVGISKDIQNDARLSLIHFDPGFRESSLSETIDLTSNNFSTAVVQLPSLETIPTRRQSKRLANTPRVYYPLFEVGNDPEAKNDLTLRDSDFELGATKTKVKTKQNTVEPAKEGKKDLLSANPFFLSGEERKMQKMLQEERRFIQEIEESQRVSSEFSKGKCMNPFLQKRLVKTKVENTDGWATFSAAPPSVWSGTQHPPFPSSENVHVGWVACIGEVLGSDSIETPFRLKESTKLKTDSVTSPIESTGLLLQRPSSGSVPFSAAPSTKLVDWFFPGSKLADNQSLNVSLEFQHLSKAETLSLDSLKLGDILDVRLDRDTVRQYLQDIYGLDRLMSPSNRSLWKSFAEYGPTSLKSGEEQMWHEKFRPSISTHFVGNEIAQQVENLKSWLTGWKSSAKVKCETKIENRPKPKRKKQLDNFIVDDDDAVDPIISDSSFDDLVSDDNASYMQAKARQKDNLKGVPKGKGESQCSDSQISNCHLRLVGPPSSGRTSSIKAVATECGFEILEINCSQRRNGKDVAGMLFEATQSHAVALDSGIGSSGHLSAKAGFTSLFGFRKTERAPSKLLDAGECSKRKRTVILHDSSDEDTIVEKNPAPVGNYSLIVVEDAEILFEQDKGFWSAMWTIIEGSKRPIIFSCSDDFLTTYNIDDVLCYVHLVLLNHGVWIDHEQLKRMCDYNPRDLRYCLLQAELLFKYSSSTLHEHAAQVSIVKPSELHQEMNFKWEFKPSESNNTHIRDQLPQYFGWGNIEISAVEPRGIGLPELESISTFSDWYASLDCLFKVAERESFEIEMNIDCSVDDTPTPFTKISRTYPSRQVYASDMLTECCEELVLLCKQHGRSFRNQSIAESASSVVGLDAFRNARDISETYIPYLALMCSLDTEEEYVNRKLRSEKEEKEIVANARSEGEALVLLSQKRAEEAHGNEIF